MDLYWWGGGGTIQLPTLERITLHSAEGWGPELVYLLPLFSLRDLLLSPPTYV